MDEIIRFFCIVHLLEEFPFVNLGTVQKGICDLARQNLYWFGFAMRGVSIPSSAGPGGKVTYTQPRESK